MDSVLERTLCGFRSCDLVACQFKERVLELVIRVLPEITKRYSAISNKWN